MATPTSYRPPAGLGIIRRPSSRMAGAFEPGSDIREDLLQAGDRQTEENQDHAIDPDVSLGQDSSSFLPPQVDVPSSLLDDSPRTVGQPRHLPAFNNTVLEEEEMKKKLADFESSFLPEPSTMSDQVDSSAASLPADIFDPHLDDSQTTAGGAPTQDHARHRQHPTHGPRSPTTTGYKTPTGEDVSQTQEENEATKHNDHTRDWPNTSALERMSSSPTAARTVSRIQSLASLGGYETAIERDDPESPTAHKRPRSVGPDRDATPRKDHSLSSTIQLNVEDVDTIPLNISRRRPQYLSKRSSVARLSYDSVTSSATEMSEATLGADFALQSGGAAPDSLRLRRKPNLTLSRSTSLGSLASGVSNISDDETTTQKRPAAGMVPELSTLQEESPYTARQTRTADSPGGLATPRVSALKLSMPTDSVIANHVRDLEVPDTVARKFRNDLSRSPEKTLSMAAMTPGPKRGLTLKEHRSTVEKLGKENFDLKMKIHFLDQALQKRSEDGIKEMITENVQLKSDRLRLEKDNHNLRKQNRELQRKLDEATGKDEADDQGYGTDDERSPTIEEEVLYLRERVEMTEIEMEKLRQENIFKEGEKRRLAEMVRNLGDSRPGASEVGSREERDMWKDMLEAETIAREQAEDDARRLRDELTKLRQDSSRPGSKLRLVKGKVISRSSSVDGPKQKADAAELDLLRHECTELQKTIGAQASALTSRNKEKEMLYQEIENLKLGRMGGLRSLAGDSILERSASRARSNSRASNGTRYTRLSDTERDSLEYKVDQLRDEVSQLKLAKQKLQSQFDEALAELDAIDAQAQADADQFNEELDLLTQDRDNALRDADEQDQAFQQLKNEAQEEIDGLGDELDAKIDECARLEEQLKTHADNVKALQAEMWSASEGLVRLEEDAQQNLARYQSVKADLDDANRELENLEKNLHEAQSKGERLTVQRESSQNEIAFLREEQDADKIKIGDLESLLKKTHLNLDAERDRAREFERRLVEERAQRDAIANQQRDSVQRTMDDLNREATNSKNELRTVRKMLSQKDIEATSFKDRLLQLEESLRQMLGFPEASSSHLVGAVSKIAKELSQANADLDNARQRLDEHKNSLKQRDELLEDNAHEFRRLEDVLEKERQYRKQDKHSFDQALKSHEQASRMVGQNNARIAELEQARLAHRKQLATLEAQYKDQLAERNQVLLTIWRKLSALCGPDWAHNHSLINGNLPSQEVIGNMLFWPGFSRNLLLAAKQLEGVLSSFKDKIKTVERDLHRNYNALEKEFESRNKKLERIEQHWEAIKLREREIDAGLATSQGTRAIRNPDSQKLRNENKHLKAELRLYQESTHGTHAGHVRSHERMSTGGGVESRSSNFSGGQMSQFDGGYNSVDAASISTNGVSGIPNRGSSVRTPKKTANTSVTLSRHNSTGAVETLSNRSESAASGPGTAQNNGFGFTIGNPGTSLAATSAQAVATDSLTSREDLRRTLVVPTGPTQYPLNGNFPIPPGSSQSNNFSEAGTITSSKPPGKNDDKKWIHRLRELERRLKNEREQRLVDRDGARRRLEERDDQNEKLKRELNRERTSRAWKSEQEARGGYLVADEPMLNEVIGQMNTHAQSREEYNPNNAEVYGYEDDELRANEEEKLSAQAQPPTVGSSHAQRAAMKQREVLERQPNRNPRPESSRTVSRGSLMSLSPTKRPGTGSLREKLGGRTASFNQSQNQNQSQSPNGSSERWGNNGCDKEVKFPSVNASTLWS